MCSKLEAGVAYLWNAAQYDIVQGWCDPAPTKGSLPFSCFEAVQLDEPQF
jgi:hypothetical protein